MPDQLQLRGGTTTEHNSFTGVAREVTVDTTKKTLVVHDASTAGGTPLMRESGGNAASAVSIGTGGNNVININSSQQVGIGTTSPSNKLVVNSAAHDDGLFVLAANNNQSTKIRIQGKSSGGTEHNWNLAVPRSADRFGIDNGVNTYLAILDSGNVGIGVTDVKAALQVNSSKNAETDRHDGSNYHLFLRNPEDDAGEACGLAFSVTSNATKTGAAIMHEREGGGSLGSLQFYTNGDGNSVTERMRISSSGEVGIGTASPARHLHLNGSDSNTVQLHITNSTTGATGNDGVSFALGSDESLIINQRESNHIALKTADTERMRIDSDGRILIGTSASLGVFGLAAQLQIAGDTAGGSSLALRRFGSSAQGAFLTFSKSRNGADGNRTIVQNGDELGRIAFCADDGTDLVHAGAEIAAFVDNTPGSNDIPGRLSFYTTPDGSTTLSERMRIDSAGKVGIGTTSPQNPLTVAGNGDTAIDIVADLDNNGVNNWAILNFKRDSVSGTPAARIYQREDDNAFVIDNNGSERIRIDSSGRLLVGTTTEGFGTADDLTIATSGDTGITIRSGTTNKGNIFFSDSTSGTDEFKGQVQYDHDIDALILHTNATPRMRIDSNGAVSVGSTANTYGGSILAANGYYVSAFNGDNLVTNSSQGGGSATLYIGNAAIQVSSDQRIKKDIVDTTLDATTKLKQVRVVDFKWNDPTDKAEVNRNSRGTWTGCLAQEMVNVFPYTVNAPRKDDNSIDTESERTWGLEYQHLVPALIKGFQEQQAEIETLKTKVAALEAA